MMNKIVTFSILISVLLISCDKSIKRRESKDMNITYYYGDDDILDSSISIGKHNKIVKKYIKIKDSLYAVKNYDSLGRIRFSGKGIKINEHVYKATGLNTEFYENGKYKCFRFIINDIENTNIPRASTCDCYTIKGEYSNFNTHSFRVYKKDSILDVYQISYFNKNKYLYVKNNNKIDSFLSKSSNKWQVNLQKIPKLNKDSYFYVKNYNLDTLKKYTTVDSKISIFKLNKESRFRILV